MVIIKAGKEEISIPCGCRVKQGNSLAPMLFIMALQVAVIEIELEFKQVKIEILSF